VFMPLFIWLVRKNAALVAALIGVLMFLYRDFYLLVPFGIGIILARHSVQAGDFFRRLPLRGKWGFLGAAVLFYNVSFWALEFQDHGRWTWCAASIGCVFFLIAALGNERIRTILCAKPFL